MNGQDAERKGRVPGLPLLGSETFEACMAKIDAFVAEGGVFVVFENSKFQAVLGNLLAGVMVTRGRKVEFFGDARSGIFALQRMVGDGLSPFLFINHDDQQDIVVLQKLKADERVKAVRVIVVSGQMYEEKVAHFIEKGADDIIVLPYAQSTIVAKIAETISPPENKRLYDEARRNLARGRVAEAMQGARRLLELYPSLPRAHELLGAVHDARGELHEAISAFEAALALERAQMFLEPRIRLARLYGVLAESSPDEGLADIYWRKQLVFLEELDRISPISMERRVQRGRLYLRFGRTETAGRVLREAYEDFVKGRKSRTEEQREEALRSGRMLIEAASGDFPEIAQDVLVELINDPMFFPLLPASDQIGLLWEYSSALEGMAAYVEDDQAYEDIFQDCKKVYEDILAMRPDEATASRTYLRLGQLFREKGRRLQGRPAKRGAAMTWREAMGAAYGFYRRAAELDEMNLDAYEGLDALGEFGSETRAGFDLRLDGREAKAGTDAPAPRQEGTVADKYMLYLDKRSIPGWLRKKD